MTSNLVSCGVDYITMTAKRGETAERLLEAGYGAAYFEKTVNRNVPRGTVIQGYKGEQVGTVFYGDREDGVIVRVSGGLSDTFVRGLGDWARGCNFPRIDIQCTAKLDWDNRWYAQTTAQKARHAATGKTQGRPAHVAYIDGADRGSTCSIGSRSSARYLRLYDKTRQQDNQVDINLWRWEVEYKPPLAPKVAGLIIGNDRDRYYIAGQVYAEFDSKGVAPSWESLEVVNMLKTEISKGTVETNLAWLRSSVAPMLRRLERAGYGKEALSALGILDSEDNTMVE